HRRRSLLSHYRHRTCDFHHFFPPQRAEECRPHFDGTTRKAYSLRGKPQRGGPVRRVSGRRYQKRRGGLLQSGANGDGRVIQGMARRYAAELVGTFVIVFAPLAMSGTSKLNGGDGSLLSAALVSGLAVLAMISAFGPISAAHFNPA